MTNTSDTMTTRGITRSAVHAFFLVLFSVLLVSCAPPEEKKVWNIVWPLPPDEPRIKFVEILKSNKDVEGPAGLGQTLFGEEIVLNLVKPYGVAVDREGKVYVSDVGRVFVFDKKNKKLSFLGGEAGTGRLRTPIGIAIGADGRVYVTDTASDKIFVYNAKGNFVTAYGEREEFEAPSGLAIDEKRGRLYIADAKKNNVRAYSFDGRLLLTIGSRGKEPGEFNFPTNVAVDSAGNLYVVDTGNFRVQIFDIEGKHLKSFGAVGDRPGNFSRPKGIAIDSEDHIYVVDAAFQNVQIFDREGQLLLYFGEGGSDPGQFSVPAGICIDSEDRIYVVDSLNSRVQVFQYLGEKWKAGEAAHPVPEAQPKQEGEPKGVEKK
ncbi:MAG: 6-bladed beta-propeller [Chloroflexota bacterium]